MEISKSHIHKLVFYIDPDINKKYFDNWKKLKTECESGENKHIYDQIRYLCHNSTNKNMPYLEKVEGGFGGHNNLINKQIRFRSWMECIYLKDNKIIFEVSKSTDIEKWTYDELDDFVQSFIQVANNNIGVDCVKGYIELTKN